ncbi:MAG: hypothetical protein H6Q41_3792 [Deltaproteobacteria bacterium]|jgi:hypothetical protein|nr:hypothetical protein [Deltaproteobacteria bacterium]
MTPFRQFTFQTDLGEKGIRGNSRRSDSVRERITVTYLTIRLFFTDLTPLTLLVISTALATAF